MVHLFQPSCAGLLEMMQVKEKNSIRRHLTIFFTISEFQSLQANLILVRNVDQTTLASITAKGSVVHTARVQRAKLPLISFLKAV